MLHLLDSLTRMPILRKFRSAARVFRDRGLSDTADLARLRAAELYRTRRHLPADPARRARMLALNLNRWGGLSSVPVEAADLAGLRGDVLEPYLRFRYSAAAAAAAELASSLRPVEAAMAADSFLAVWDFPGIVASAPGWTRAAAGTPYALRIAQAARRALLRLGRLEEAATGLEVTGDDRGALALQGDVCDALGRMDAARTAYEAAIRRDGSDAYVREVYGFHLMKAGRVRDGLASWMAADLLAGNYPLRRDRPQWTGEPLGTRRLMVLFEHGLGDMIQMARFLPRLIAREPAASVMARVPAPLLGLFARQFRTVRLVAEDAREPDYDLFAPSMHLAGVLDAPDLEPRTRYLDLGAPLARGSARPRVGVCWRGHPRQYEFTRSIPIGLFSTLFAARDVDFAVLLNRLTPEEEASIAREPNVEAPPISDFVDLAALVASCDLVVSVDTAVVHLAGAGGVPTLLLSRPDSCWRWGTAGAEGPWYRSVEVLRHGGDLNWPALLDAAAARIRMLGRAAAA
ncbi:glycosyltransferase family 9 protein [Lichenibacterium dinghuense]|uniref:glycosyltransferase family 9 protein n=1 Tax=Lichenibacterium dinghuense TaxID=2895977 RepID=UPI001F291629|nr:glycosyltransferase family 9 protein [Lichenibacterium sp. 6Y81]